MHQIRVSSVVSLLGSGLLLAACQTSNAPVNQQALLTQLTNHKVPVTNITLKENCVAVNMSYDPEGDNVYGPIVNSHVRYIIAYACEYAYGYCVDIRYTGELHVPIEWGQMKDFCDGKTTIDNVDYIYTYQP